MASSRKRFIAAGASAFASVGILKWPAGAAEFTYKYANDNPLTHPMGIAMTAWADKVKQESNGQLEIQVFPASQLGSDPEMLTQIRAGGLQFLHLSGGLLSTLVPVTSIDGIGFAMTNYKQVWGALDGELGAYIRGEVSKTGLHIFDKQVDNGFRVITSAGKPVNAPADLKGMKIRVPPARLYVSMFTTLGASPTAISVAEVYSALQTKVVDAQENPLVIIQNNKFYEVQKYVALTNHMWSGWWLLSNGDAWTKLGPKLQDICARNYDVAVAAERQNFAHMNSGLQPRLKAEGMIFNTPDVEPFRKMLQTGGYYTEWKTTFGDKAWSLLEKSTGKIS